MKPIGNVEGTIKNREGVAQEGATVQIDGTELIAVTGSKGDYRINAVPSGRQSITASMVIAKQTKDVDIPEDGTVQVDFVMNPLAP